MASEYFKAKVYNIIDETKTIKRFQIEFPELDIFDFKAGQYVKVDMPIDDKKTYRQYSIASEPIGDNKIELLIVRAEHGKGTKYLFEDVKIGTELQVSKALGRFVIPDNIEKEICFICTGVGLAPFRAMYLDILNKNKNHKGINLIFGTRYKEDLCYPDEIYALQEKHLNFKYYPVLSRESEENWSGHKGYVHKVYNEIYADKHPALFYLCGWDDMIKEARKSLIEQGYEKREIMFEKYD